MRAVRIEAPLVKPVSLAEAKAHLRVDHTDDDSLIAMYIDSAIGYLEGSGVCRDGVLGRVMITQTWRVEDEKPASGRISLDPGPVASIESVSAIVDGVETALDKDDFVLAARGSRTFIEPASGKSWPSCDARDDAIRVTFKAGYGDAASDVPAPMRAAVMLIVDHLYENRAGVVTGMQPPSLLPFGISTLIAPFRVVTV